jgi:hypothetical protein
MAATISVNFATIQEVFSEDPENPPPSKKSVSAKVLADALGGGVIGGGYVRRTGDTMKGTLTLQSSMPLEPFEAAPKAYVDSHSYTRRYKYVCQADNTNYGYVTPNTTILSGLDLNANQLYFFNRGDEALQNIVQYMDVYRNGILQLNGELPGGDFRILSIPGISPFPGVSAVQFHVPFSSGETFQVSIGNMGASPVTFGVERLYGDYGIITNRVSGDCTLNVTPTSFTANNYQVSARTEMNYFLSPKNLSAYPLIPKAGGYFERTYARPEPDAILPDPRYGSQNGFYSSIFSSNIEYVRSGVDNGNQNPSSVFYVKFTDGTVLDSNYSAIITISQFTYTTEKTSTATVIADNTKTTEGFRFYVVDALISDPEDIDAINILVF